MTKKLFIKTWGCQMNEYDTVRMRQVLGSLDYREAARPEDADLLIFNTCDIREKAAEKLFSELGRLRTWHRDRARQGRPVMVAVAGCVAQAQGREIVRRAPMVDIVVGPQTYHRLPDLITQRQQQVGGQPLLCLDFPVESKFDGLQAPGRVGGPCAYLSVQEGCDKFCTFCVVPYTRGAEFSRPVDQVLTEARQLIAGGVKEITLLGQNVNAYHGESPSGRPWTLGLLIRALAELEGLLRIRYTTSHPRDLDADLISAHEQVPQLMPWMHLPLQSGSDRVLAAMNRRHTLEDYLEVIARLRRARPDIALSSDFIVGFPGETDRDFEHTLAAVERIGYAQAYSFKYSVRPGTPAAGRSDQVDESVKGRRLAALQELLGRQQRVFNEASLGRVVPVLLHKKGRYPWQMQGKTPHMQTVHLSAAVDRIGEQVMVRIDEVTAHTLTGVLVDSSHPPSESLPPPTDSRGPWPSQLNVPAQSVSAPTITDAPN